MPDVVTFCMYTRDGRIMMVQRGLFDPTGKPLKGAGHYTVNGGVLKPGEDVLAGLRRKLEEEYGIAPSEDDVLRKSFATYVGPFDDVVEGRTNYLFRINVSLEDLAFSSDNSSLKTVFEQMVLKPKGFGTTPMTLMDINGLAEAGLLRPVAAHIFNAFPYLRPKD